MVSRCPLFFERGAVRFVGLLATNSFNFCVIRAIQGILRKGKKAAVD